MTYPSYIAFLVATLALVLIPGPAVFYVVGRSIEHGVKAGVFSVAGITLGSFFHLLVACYGLSALLVASPMAFNTVKFCGAGYLIYLGLSKFFEKPSGNKETYKVEHSLSRIFWQGLVVQILNPKTALFFISFLPLFVNPGQGSVTAQIFNLGMTFIIMACITDSTYAISAGFLAKKLGWGQNKEENPRLVFLQRSVSALIYLGLGIAALLIKK